MIKEFKCFTFLCDNCGFDLNEESEFAGFDSVSANEYIAREADWHIDGNNHYCPDCYYIDDDDNIAINTKSKVK